MFGSQWLYGERKNLLFVHAHRHKHTHKCEHRQTHTFRIWIQVWEKQSESSKRVSNKLNCDDDVLNVMNVIPLLQKQSYTHTHHTIIHRKTIQSSILWTKTCNGINLLIHGFYHSKKKSTSAVRCYYFYTHTHTNI